jgi:hypothetical protein
MGHCAALGPLISLAHAPIVSCATRARHPPLSHSPASAPIRASAPLDPILFPAAAWSCRRPCSPRAKSLVSHRPPSFFLFGSTFLSLGRLVVSCAGGRAHRRPEHRRTAATAIAQCIHVHTLNIGMHVYVMSICFYKIYHTYFPVIIIVRN